MIMMESWLLLVLACTVAVADDLQGKVTDVKEGTAVVQLDGDLMPNVGDKVEVTCRMPDYDDPMHAANGVVVEVNDDGVTVKLDAGGAPVRVGYQARIACDKPQKRVRMASEAMTDAEKQAKIGETERGLDAALAKGDTQAILKSLGDLVALGEASYPKVIKLLGDIFKDLEGDKKYKLDETHVYALLSSKPFLGFFKWELANTNLPMAARRGAVQSMLWQSDPSVTSILASDLKEEKDRVVAKTIIEAFTMKSDPKSEEAILELLDSRRDNKEIRMDAVNALWQLGDDAAMKALTRASQGDSDADVREAARIASKAIEPPVAGYMVNYVDSDSGVAVAGLKRGDIILSYDGRTIRDTNALTELSGKTDGRAQVPVQIYRDGRTITLDVKGGVIDVWGRHVKPKH